MDGSVVLAVVILGIGVVLAAEASEVLEPDAEPEEYEEFERYRR